MRLSCCWTPILGLPIPGCAVAGRGFPSRGVPHCAQRGWGAGRGPLSAAGVWGPEGGREARGGLAPWAPLRPAASCSRVHPSACRRLGATAAPARGRAAAEGRGLFGTKVIGATGFFRFAPWIARSLHSDSPLNS